MAGYNSDPSNIMSSCSSESSSENIFSVEAAVHHTTNVFYGARRGLRPRQLLPPTQSDVSSNTDGLDSDDSVKDPDHVPVDAVDAGSDSDDTARVPRQRGRPRSRGASVRGADGQGYQLATGGRGRQGSPDMFPEDNVSQRGQRQRGRPRSRGASVRGATGRGHRSRGRGRVAVTPIISAESDPELNVSDNQADPAPRGLRTPPGVAALSNKGPGRKHQSNPDGWARNVAKTSRARGLAYTSVNTGKEVAAAKVGAPCKCPKKCFNLVGEENINIIFNSYCNIADYTAQSAYLGGRIRSRAVKRRRQADPEKPSKVQYAYVVSVLPLEFEVCREAFASIHGIGLSKIRKLIKDRETHPTGTPVEDGRGKGEAANKITGERLQHVHDHIHSLAVTASHYSRAHSPHRRYLSAEFTVKKLWDRYHHWIELTYPDEEAVTESFYRHIFTKCYNIVTTPQGKDICDYCEELRVNIEEAEDAAVITAIENDLAAHKLQATKQQSKLSEAERQCAADGPNSGTRTICIDLQQTLPCPKLRNQSAYYKRKEWFYNLCIYDLNTKHANCFLWGETQAKRGSDEVASCILKWFSLNKEAGFKKLRIFADNCAGQNKNIYLILTLLRMLHNADLEEVTLEFMVAGHTFLPCDRAFGVIEASIKKKPSVNCPDEYATIIAGAIESNVVIRMERTDFVDVKLLLEKITLRIPQPPVMFSKGRTFTLTRNKPWVYKIQSALGTQEVNLEKGSKGPPSKTKNKDRAPTPLLNTEPLRFKYLTHLKLPEGKMQDLLALRAFLNERGKRWLEETRLQQSTAHLVEDTNDEHEQTTDPENFADDNALEYTNVPQPLPQ